MNSCFAWHNVFRMYVLITPRAVVYCAEAGKKLAAHFGKPPFQRLRLLGGNGLDKPQKLFHISDISISHLSIGSWQFQLVTICYQLISFLNKTTLQYLPILSSRLIVAFCQHRNHIHDREVILFPFRIPNATNLLVFKQLYSKFLFYNPMIFSFFY